MKSILFFIAIIAALSFVESETAHTTNNNETLLPQVELTSPMPNSITAEEKSIFPGQNKKAILKALVSVNYGGTVPYGPICTEAMRIGLNQLAKSAMSFFDKYTLQLELANDNCYEGYGTNLNLMRLQNDRLFKEPIIPIFLMGPCSFTSHFAPVLKYFDFNGLSVMSMDPKILNDRRRFDGFYDVYDMNDHVYYGVAKFIAMNGWRRVAILSEMAAYWTVLENTLVGELDTEKITLLGIAKYGLVENQGPVIESLEAAVQELRFLDARIIVLHSTTPSLVACMLAKHGFYGQFYVFIANGVVLIDPLQSPRYQPWCTQKMLYDVAKSIVVFNGGLYNEYDPLKVGKDSFDMDGIEYDQQLRARIKNPDRSPFWSQIRTTCYEQVTTLGGLLNATENYLNKERNESLQDWVTNSDNFLQNSSFIFQAIKKNVATLKFRTLSHDLDFSVTGISSKTRSVVPKFSQYRNVNNTSLKLQLVIVISMDYDTKELVAHGGTGNITWLTKNGFPPPDSVHVVTIIQPGMPDVANGIIGGISALLIVAELFAVILTGLAFARVIRFVSVARSVAAFRFPVLIGDILMNLFNLVSIGNCTTSVCFLLIGFSLMVAAHAGKLEICRNYIVFRRSLPMLVRIAKLRLGMVKRTMSLTAGIIAIHAILVAAFFAIHPIRTSLFLVDNPQSQQTNLGISYKLWSEYCDYTFAASNWKWTATQSILIGAWLFLNGVVIMRAVYLSFSMRNRKSSHCHDMGKTCVVVFSIVVTVLCGVTIAAILQRRFETSLSVVQMTVGVVVIFCSIANLTLTFLMKLRISLRQVRRAMITRFTIHSRRAATGPPSVRLRVFS